MGRPRTIRDADILDAARALFRERGHAVPTREIAQAAGVSQAVLYQRFPSKTELFFAAMSPETPDIDALLGTPFVPTPAYLEAVTKRLLAYFEQSLPTVVQLLAHPEFEPSVMGRLHERILSKHLVGGLTARLRVLQGEGLVGEVDAEAAAQAFIAMLHSFAMFHVMGGASLGKRSGAIAAKLIAVLWSGLMPRR